MGAIQAIDIGLKAGVFPGAAKNRSKSKKQNAKVIRLPVRRRTKPRELTDAERQVIVVEHRPKAQKLARSILRKWHARLDLEEVDSVVDLSLCEAVRRFDPTKGASFMTFLYYHLRGNLIRAVSTAANANCIPLSDVIHQDINVERNSRRHNSARSITAIEVAEALCSHENPLPDEMLFKKELVRLSQQACENLDELEREVIGRVFLDEQQLMDVARLLGYSRCHISRVKKKALETLKSYMKANGENLRRDPDALGSPRNKLVGLRQVARRGAQRRRIIVSRKRTGVGEKVALLRAVN